jgi:hypothetical protein
VEAEGRDFKAIKAIVTLLQKSGKDNDEIIQVWEEKIEKGLSTIENLNTLTKLHWYWNDIE